MLEGSVAQAQNSKLDIFEKILAFVQFLNPGHKFLAVCGRASIAIGGHDKNSWASELKELIFIDISNVSDWNQETFTLEFVL